MTVINTPPGFRQLSKDEWVIESKDVEEWRDEGDNVFHNGDFVKKSDDGKIVNVNFDKATHVIVGILNDRIYVRSA